MRVRKLPNFVSSDGLLMLPCFVQTLGLQARPQIEAANAARVKGEIYIGVNPVIRNRAVYTEFIVAQVKVSPLAL